MWPVYESIFVVFFGRDLLRPLGVMSSASVVSAMGTMGDCGWLWVLGVRCYVCVASAADGF